MDTVKNNRVAWESASEKHVREYDDLLHQAMYRSSLLERELDLLRPLLAPTPAVVHLMSGHGLDDVALVAAGARSVVASTSAWSRPPPPSAGRTSWASRAATWLLSCPAPRCATPAQTSCTRARER